MQGVLSIIDPILETSKEYYLGLGKNNSFVMKMRTICRALSGEFQILQQFLLNKNEKNWYCNV